MGFGPAIIKQEDGSVKLHHISSSQVNTYESCPNRWFEEKVQGAPSFSDWSWAQAGVAAHEILEEQISAVIDKPFDQEKRRVLDPKVQEEAEQLVAFFQWEQYFEGHEIVDTEMDMVLNLSDVDYETKVGLLGEEDAKRIDLPLFVGSMDVVSINEDGVIVITDWKTGYGSNSGVDIQAKAYALGIMRNMGCEEAIFRRIYPRLAGEERGTKKIEEYYFDISDATRYAAKIVYLAAKMKKTAEDIVITPKVTASNKCVHCPIAYRCPIASSAAFTPKELVAKQKVLKAALKQTDNALKDVVDKGGDFFVGDEHYGYVMSESFRAPKGGMKANELVAFLAKENPELLGEFAKVSVNPEIKNYLKEKGFDGYKNIQRKTFKLLNEDELKKAAKQAKKDETTQAEQAKKAS